MNKPLINLNDVELKERPPAFAPTGDAAERFSSTVGMIGPMLGARKLGYNITCVPPGKRAFPYHNHLVNEEMFLILEGTGEIRIGAEVYTVKPMDIIACPPGGEETAHQIVNTGDIDIKYLSVSTRQSPEVGSYPDSGKFGVIADYPPDEEGKAKRLIFVGREGESLDYWEGE